MKHKQTLIILLISLLGLSLVSCDILSSSGAPSTKRGPISLVNPQVGQSSRYLRFSHDCFYCRTAIRKFQPDTLIVELIAIEDGALILRERISKGSLSHRDSAHSASVGVPRPGDVYDYRLKIVSDTIVFSEYTPGRFSSYHFLNIETAQIPLSGIPEILILLDLWKASICACDMIGLTDGFSQLGNEYEELIVIIEQEMMAADGPGFVCVYSFEAGFVQTYWSNPWTNYSLGWAKLY